MAKINDIEKKINDIEKIIEIEETNIPYKTLKNAELRHENEAMRLARIIKYLIISNFLIALLLVITNGLWIAY